MKVTELDESLWVGDNHKITTQGGKNKFNKRNRSTMPADIKGGQKTGPTANVAMAENTDATLDSIVEKYPTELESILTGNSFLTDHDKFYDELYEYFVTGAGRGEMPYGVAKARDGDPDQWITEYLEQEYGRNFYHGDPESMDGDFDSAMASAGHGTDEDYGYYGESEEVEEGFGQFHYKATSDGNFAYKGKTYSSEQSAREAETDDKAARMGRGEDYKDITPGPVTDPWGKPTRKTGKTG